MPLRDPRSTQTMTDTQFWSMRTLTILLEAAGFHDIRFERVGRIPPLAKAMIAVARRPVSARVENYDYRFSSAPLGASDDHRHTLAPGI